MVINRLNRIIFDKQNQKQINKIKEAIYTISRKYRRPGVPVVIRLS